MQKYLNSHTDQCMEQIEQLLKPLDPITREMAVNMLSYTERPIEGHEEVSRMISAFVSLLSSKANPDSDNPVIIAAYTVTRIYKIAHGQARELAREAQVHYEDAAADLTAAVLDILQHLTLVNIA